MVEFWNTFYTLFYLIFCTVNRGAEKEKSRKMKISSASFAHTSIPTQVLTHAQHQLSP